MIEAFKKSVAQIRDMITKKPEPAKVEEKVVVTKPTPKGPVDKLPDGRPYLITRKEILMGRDVEFPTTPEIEENLAKLLLAANYLRYDYGKPLVVSSGYRPGKFNVLAGGAKNSTHLTCQAVDFGDADRKFTNWCLQNLDKLEKYGLWMENPLDATSWVHLDLKSRNVRVFRA